MKNGKKVGADQWGGAFVLLGIAVLGLHSLGVFDNWGARDTRVELSSTKQEAPPPSPRQALGAVAESTREEARKLQTLQGQLLQLTQQLEASQRRLASIEEQARVSLNEKPRRERVLASSRSTNSAAAPKLESNLRARILGPFELASEVVSGRPYLRVLRGSKAGSDTDGALLRPQGISYYHELVRAAIKSGIDEIAIVSPFPSADNNLPSARAEVLRNYLQSISEGQLRIVDLKVSRERLDDDLLDLWIADAAPNQGGAR
jgi:hypothetical protein